MIHDNVEYDLELEDLIDLEYDLLTDREFEVDREAEQLNGWEYRCHNS